MLSVWGQLNLQEGMSTIMELMNYFHDYMMIILVLIMTFVTYLFIFVITSPRLDKYTVDSHILETVWTIVPMVILLFMAFPSLYLLYLMEDVSNPNLMVKVVGHQWYWEYQYSNSWFNYVDMFPLESVSVYFSKWKFLTTESYQNKGSEQTNVFFVTADNDGRFFIIPYMKTFASLLFWFGHICYMYWLVMMQSMYVVSEICGSNHSFMPIVLEFIPMANYLDYVVSLSSQE
nr:cytochrome c oxidase subunit II [Brachionus calyciflorus]